MPRRRREQQRKRILNRDANSVWWVRVGPRRYSFWKPPRKCWEPMKFDNWCSRCPLLISCPSTKGFTKSSLIHPALPHTHASGFFFTFQGWAIATISWASIYITHCISHAGTGTVVLNLSVRQDRLGAVIQHTDSQIPDRNFWCWSLGLGMKIWIFHQFLGEAAPGGLGPHFEKLYWKGHPKADGEFVHHLEDFVFTAESPAQPLSRVHRHCGFPRDLLLLFTSLAQAHPSTSSVCTKHYPMLCFFTLAVFADTSLSGEIFLFLYWVNSHISQDSAGMSLSHETITGSFRNSIFSLCFSVPLIWNLAHCIFFKKIFWCGPLKKFLLDLLPHCFQSFP